jgi:hypothetical protein
VNQQEAAPLSETYGGLVGVLQRVVRHVQGNRWLDRLFLAAAMAFFLRGWLKGGAPASPRLEMIPGLSFTWRLRRQIVRGHLLPEWDPYEFGGFPWTRFLSWPLYLGVALATLLTGLSVETWMVVLYVLAYALSAVAMYEWVYAATRRRSAALVAGLVYGAFPYHLQMGMEWWEYAVFWAVLPVPFALYEWGRKDEARRWLWWAAMGASLGLFPVVNIERTPVSLVCFLMYICLRQVGSLVQRRSHIWKDTVGLLLAGLMALGLAAAVVLPALVELPDIAVHLKRATALLFPPEVQADYAISPRLLAVAALRRLHLPASTEGLPGVWDSFGGVNAWYVGLVALGMAALGVLRFRKTWVVPITLTVVLFGLLVALGPRAPFDPLGFIPVLGDSRFQAHRGMMVVALGMAVLAGQGVAWLVSYVRKHWLRAGVTLALLALVGFDFHPGSAVFQVRPSYFASDEVQAYRWLAEQGEGFRAWDYALSPSNSYLYTYGIVEAPVPRFWGQYDDGAAVHAFSLVSWGDQARALELNAVRYILFRSMLPHHQDAMGQMQECGYDRVAWRSERLTIMERSQPALMARLYSRSALRVGPDNEGELGWLPELLDRGVALVSGGSPYLDDYGLERLRAYDHLFIEDAQVRSPGVRSEVEENLGDRIVTDMESIAGGGSSGAGYCGKAVVAPRLVEGGTGPHDIEVWAAVGEPALLMVSESWYPNWQVSVDGEPAELLRTNHAFLGVRVPAGEHLVLFHYVRPWSTWVGLAISLGMLLLLVLAAVGRGKWRR